MIFSGTIGLLSLIVLLPLVRNQIILFGEKYVGRPLTHEVWHARFIRWEIYIFVCFIFITTFFAYFYVNSIPKLYKNLQGIFYLRKTVSDIKKSKMHGAELLIILASLIALRCFYISQKKSLHVDEGLSIAICNRNEFGFWSSNYELGYEPYVEYNSKELKELSLWDNPSIIDSISDVFHLHQDNKDSPHTNLYYSFLRIWFTGVKTYNLKYIFWRACLLNVLFFIVSFFFMILLIRKFTNNQILICLILLIAFMNPPSLSLTVFIRPYELQQTLIIIFTYFVTCSLQAIETNVQFETKKYFIIGIFVLAFTMLSAYFNIILVGLFGITLIILLARRKNYNLLSVFILMFILSLCVAKLFYFKFGNMGERGQEAANKLSLFYIFDNLCAVKNGLIEIFTNNIFFEIYSLSILICCGFIVFSRKEKLAKVQSIVLGVNIISLFVIFYFAPIDMKTLRYIAPLFSVFALAFIFYFKNQKLNIVIAGFAVLVLIGALIPTKKGMQNVEHLDDSEIASYKELQETKLPIFVRGEKSWGHACLIPYLSDNQKVIFVLNFEDIKQKYPDMKKYIFINQFDNSEKSNIDYESYNLEKINKISFYDIYSAVE